VDKLSGAGTFFEQRAREKAENITNKFRFAKKWSIIFPCL